MDGAVLDVLASVLASCLASQYAKKTEHAERLRVLREAVQKENTPDVLTRLVARHSLSPPQVRVPAPPCACPPRTAARAPRVPCSFCLKPVPGAYVDSPARAAARIA